MESINYYPNRKFLLNSIPRQQFNNNSIISINYNPNIKNVNLMPSKFQSSDNGASFSQGRNIFFNVENENIPTNNFSLKKAFLNDQTKNCNCDTNCKNSVCKCKECNVKNKNLTCNVGKYLSVQSSDQYIQRLKNRAIGSGSLPKKEGNNYIASFSGNNTKNSVNYQNTQQALKRLRNRGYIVPPKVTAYPKCN